MAMNPFAKKPAGKTAPKPFGGKQMPAAIGKGKTNHGGMAVGKGAKPFKKGGKC